MSQEPPEASVGTHAQLAFLHLPFSAHPLVPLPWVRGSEWRPSNSAALQGTLPGSRSSTPLWPPEQLAAWAGKDLMGGLCLKRCSLQGLSDDGGTSAFQ